LKAAPSVPKLEFLFNPRAVAVVGVSTDLSKVGPGRFFVKAQIEAGFKGKIYPVGVSGGRIFGRKIYRRLTDIPGEVDYVISSVPAAHAVALMHDCVAKKVRAVHMFTAGFSEISDKKGAVLQAELAEIARAAGIRLLGPNCMGLYCPEAGIAFELDLPSEKGDIGFVSQSGGNAIKAIRDADIRGLHFSKIISYGNAADLDETDFLEYLTDDPKTRIITAYFEGVKDGPRFRQALERAAKKKPVIIYKGGFGSPGARAVASHTGAIAGSDRVWEALLKQAGAIQVYSLDEMLDMLSLFSRTAPPKGNRAGIIGIGGGNNVLVTDDCVRAGISVPPFSRRLRKELKGLYLSEAGASFRNPVDMYFAKFELVEATVRVVDSCPDIDMTIIHITIGWSPKENVNMARQHAEMIGKLNGKTAKPIIVVLRPFGPSRYQPDVGKCEQILNKAGIAAFFSVTGAAEAMLKYIDYFKRKKR
jgi:acetate---CoA ligase (ADP-forming) subunit alpha